ncbi:MAG: hypothetical protein LLG93_01795, partial [Deltaproteobacteria bacterium]|nr:hypothetical protein [Deltaproteobacteria bacterium]
KIPTNLKSLKKIPPAVWLGALALVLLLDVVGGLAGWGKLTSTTRDLEKTKKERTALETQAAAATQSAETWRKAATSSKRIRIRKSAAVTKAGEVVRNADGTVVFNETFEEIATAGREATGNSSTASTSWSSATTTISVADYEKLLETKTEKSNLRFFVGPSLRVKPGSSIDPKMWGIQGGARIWWRLGGSLNVTTEGEATGALNYYL